MKGKNTENRARKTLDAAKDALRGLDGSITDVIRAAKTIKDRKGDIVVTGIGKSGFIGQKFTASLVSLGERAFYIHPTEALHGDLGILSKGDVLIALSFSGESKEVISIVNYAKKNFNVPVVVLCKNKGSSLGRISDCCVEVPVESEGSPNGFAPMASTTATLVICDMIVAAVINGAFKDKHFAVYHPGGSLGLRLKQVKDSMISGSKVPKVKKTSSFLDAIKEINNKNLGVTAVVGSQDNVVGVITDGDIRRFILQSNKMDECLAKDVMTSKPKCVQEEDSLQIALSTMENYKITSIFVVNSKKQLTGIIHVHNIIEQTL